MSAPTEDGMTGSVCGLTTADLAAAAAIVQCSRSPNAGPLSEAPVGGHSTAPGRAHR